MRTALYVLGLLVATWLILIGALIMSGRGEAARRLAAFLPNLVFLFRGLLRDARVPRSSKALLLLAVGWFASPIDLIPEFLPVVGPLDDAIVAAIVLRHVARSVGADVLQDHWRGDPATLERLLRFARIPTEHKEDDREVSS